MPATMPHTNLETFVETLKRRWEDALRTPGPAFWRNDGTPRTMILPLDVMWIHRGDSFYVKTIRSSQEYFVGLQCSNVFEGVAP